MRWNAALLEKFKAKNKYSIDSEDLIVRNIHILDI